MRQHDLLGTSSAAWGRSHRTETRDLPTTVTGGRIHRGREGTASPIEMDCGILKEQSQRSVMRPDVYAPAASPRSVTLFGHRELEAARRSITENDTVRQRVDIVDKALLDQPKERRRTNLHASSIARKIRPCMLDPGDLTP